VRCSLFCSWIFFREYQKGCDWEIYTTPLAKVFEGAKFCELSYALYEKVGVVLFALQITDAAVGGASKLLLNPATFVIPSQNDFIIEAFVIAQNKASSDLSFANTRTDAAQQALRNIEAGFQTAGRNISSSFEKLRKGTRDVEGAKLEAFRATLNAKAAADAAASKTSSTRAKNRWKSLKRSALVAKKVESFSYREILHQLEDLHMKKEYYLREKAADIQQCIVKTNVIEEVPFINHHVIIIGKGLGNLFDLIRPLRARYLGTLRYIVIITPEEIPHDVWSKISHFDAILVVRGSPLEEANLRRAGIFRATQVVVLAGGEVDAGANGGVGMEALVDSDAIFSYQLVKRMNPETQIVTEIVNTSNISYLDTDSSSKFDNYKFSTQFAAGNLFTTSLLDSLVCQVFKLICFCSQRFFCSHFLFFVSIYFCFLNLIISFYLLSGVLQSLNYQGAEQVDQWSGLPGRRRACRRSHGAHRSPGVECGRRRGCWCWQHWGRVLRERPAGEERALGVRFRGRRQLRRECAWRRKEKEEAEAVS
jgi:hypothetical protein